MDQDLKKNILSTGTSLVGIVCKDGVVMGSDRRVSAGGMLVVGKNFQKTSQINDYLVISVAGTVSDAQLNSKVIAAQLKLKELKDKQRPTVKEAASYIAMMKFQNIRRPSMIPAIVANLVGGINEDGTSELYNIGPDGSITLVDDYDASGSGTILMLGLLERQYKKNLSTKEGIELVIESIKSSSARDTASGNGVDVFTITKEGIKHVSKQTVENVYKEQN